MNTKKLISMILCLALCFGVLAGCGSKTETPAADAGAAAPDGTGTEKHTIAFGHFLAVNHNEHLALEELQKMVAEKSDGRLELVIYPAGQLGSEREIAEMVTMGTCDMSMSDGPTWSNALNIPELAVFGLPFLYADIDGELEAFKNVIRDKAAEYMVPAGVRPLFAFSMSVRGTMTTTKPITKLTDISGIKMRVPEITMYVDTWKALGANATTTAWSECYTSLAQGVVDGCEADPTTLVSANLQEVCKYYSETNHMGCIHICTINEAKWQTIPADLQEIFIECANEVMEKQFSDRKVTDEEAIQTMKDANVEIVQVPAEERAKMIEAIQSIYDKYVNTYGLGDLIATLQKYGGTA
jgi:tripartite ATP-independent transporter DctP family solute receptor